MTKGKSKAFKRRQIRRKEKGSLLITDKMMGACAARGYGDGRASGKFNRKHVD